MPSYRYYLIPDAMMSAFPERLETPTPRESFDSTEELKRRYLQLREQPYNNEPTYNESTKQPYVRLEVGIERKDPDAALAVVHALSVSDIVVMQRDGKEQALYVDSVGFRNVSYLLPELHELAAQRQKEQVQEEPER